MAAVTCPVCSRQVPEASINQHLDAACRDIGAPAVSPAQPSVNSASASASSSSSRARQVAPIFTKAAKRPPPSSLPGPSTPHPQPSKRRPLHDVNPPSSQQASSKRQKTSTISSRLEQAAPLAERLRPKSLDDFVGHVHLTGPDSLLFNLTEKGAVGNLIFWGPPGCGKTTLARLLAKRTDAIFKELSATIVGINDVRPIFEEAKNTLQLTGRRTIIFLDEVHRFTKSQQDIFLPFLEHGHVQLIGATTENPSFKLNAALLSRCRVFVLKRLTDEEITEIIKKAVARVAANVQTDAADPTPVLTPSSSPAVPDGSSPRLSEPSSSPNVPLFPAYPQFTPRVLTTLTSLSTGDARTALSLVELVLLSSRSTPESVLLDSLRASVSTSYDRTGDSHYDLISALHKSVRGSQGTAALYWLARMLEAGEDPVYIARRMVVCASEDIGLADNHALPLAMAAMQACQQIGMPECRINLAHVVSYLAEAPKSTRAYEGYGRAEVAAKHDMTLPVPLAMRNAPTKLMKELDYGKGYNYNPDFAHPVTNEYLPPEIRGKVFLRKDGDLDGKMWDDVALREWECEQNDGREWDGPRRNTGDVL
ncbi:P-loop containing nucleoside triphosphate hydrolase protein [Artomyces pyxidatus]|uniref:P-loop containing nucleoside triphosphate hydrolase protein n=1 Tax=Artomyces pyxidatus TaxID=48021 RepID=A0ACB8T2F4_9AGAM|nr:P-loop containing nucleoside triphosphate hydrolase protein [Artomyces pyxidatus]